jgi:hypothetical protein
MSVSKTEQIRDYSNVPTWWQEGKDLGLVSNEDLFRYCEISLKELELSSRVNRAHLLVKEMYPQMSELVFALSRIANGK